MRVNYSAAGDRLYLLINRFWERVNVDACCYESDDALHAILAWQATQSKDAVETKDGFWNLLGLFTTRLIPLSWTELLEEEKEEILQILEGLDDQKGLRNQKSLRQQWAFSEYRSVNAMAKQLEVLQKKASTTL